MADNRATELLCKMLEERGEDYTRNDFGITWSYYSDPHTATESMDGTLIVTGLTPEQAIAATLGLVDEPDNIRNELADGGLIADVLAPVCVDEKERRAFERGRVHERFAQQIFKEATS